MRPEVSRAFAREEEIMERSPAAKVGMVVAGALALFLWVVLQFGNVTREPGDRYFVLFEDVGGLQVRAPVTMAGVRIGYVSEVALSPENRVRVTMLITRRGVELFGHEQYTYTIAGNFMGDKWVEIRPGAVPEGVAALQPEDQVQGSSPVTMDDLAREGSQVLKELQVSVLALNELLGDEKFQSDIKLTMTHFKEISSNLKGASVEARALISGLNSRVGRLAGALERVVANVDQTVVAFREDTGAIGRSLRDTTGAVQGLVKDNSGSVETIVLNLREMSSSLQRTARALEGLATDEELQGDVVAAVRSVRQATEEVAAIAGDLRSLTGDPKVQEDIKVTLSNAREASDSARRVMGKVEGVVSGDSKLVQVDLGHEWNPDNGRPATNLNALLFPEGPFTAKLGVESLGQHNLLNLQAGRTWDSFRLRGGVVRGQFGVGADAWLFDRRFETNLDVYDTRDVKVDVLGRLLLPGDFYVYGGVRDATDRQHSHPVVGAGKRF